MTIRMQNLLFIVPLFVGVAALNGVLSYREQVAEIDWGMVEGIEALAITAGEFIDADLCRQLIQEETISPEVKARIIAPVQRLFEMDLHRQSAGRQWLEKNRIWRRLMPFFESLEQAEGAWGSLRQVFILAPDGREIPFTLGQNTAVHEALFTLPRLLAAVGQERVSLFYRTAGDKRIDLGQDRLAGTAELLDIIGRGNVIFTSVYPISPQRCAMAAYSPIRSASGELAGIFGVELDATAFQFPKRVAFVKGLILAGVTLSFGVLVALFIAAVMTRKIRQLNEVAAAAVAGNYKLRVDLKTVEEVVDLGSTFNTMNSILEEVFGQARREPLDAERFRTRAELAGKYRELLWEPQRQVHAGVQIVAQSISRHPTGDFFGIFATAVRTCVVLGRVRAEEELAAVSLAAAAHSLIRQRMGEFEPERVGAELCQSFAVETWKCIFWDAGASQLQWLTGNLGDTTLSRGTIELQEGRPLLFHTLGKVAGKKAELYVRLFNHLSPVQLMEDLAAIAAEEREGSILLLGCARMGNSCGMS